MAASAIIAAARKKARKTDSPAAFTSATYCSTRAFRASEDSPACAMGNSSPDVSTWNCSTPQADIAASPKVMPIMRATVTSDAAVAR